MWKPTLKKKGHETTEIIAGSPCLKGTIDPEYHDPSLVF